MAQISLDKITKVYPNGFEAVHSLDLDVAEGEFMVLVGPSGCGKTTALRMVAGLEEISRGTLRIRRAGRQQRLVEGPRHRDGLPELRALPAHDGRREHRLRPANCGSCRRREIKEKVADGGGRSSDSRELLDSQARAALGRPAPARRHGPRDRARAQRLLDGRAALEPRRQAARADARRGARASSAASASRRSTSPTTRSRR